MWKASPTIFELRAATMVICELWAKIKSVYELRVNNQAVSMESYQSELY